jgi:mRNA interferase RelE/StbE
VAYRVLILRRAQKELAALLEPHYRRVKEALLALASDPRPLGARKLSGRDGWRIRIGNYRAIYEIDDAAQRVTVLHVGHRSDVYR